MAEVNNTENTLIEGHSECESESIHKKILTLKNEIEMDFIKLGGYLKLVNDKKLYIGRGCESFNEYLAMPELSFQRSTAYAIMGVFTDFIESGLSEVSDIENIGYYKLDRIRQFISGPKEKLEEWVEKARTLSLSDLNTEIREAKGEPEKVYNPKSRMVTLTCPHCGKSFGYTIKD